MAQAPTVPKTLCKLRGVNLGGSSKVPARPDGATWRREGFFEHRNVSFVGRPVPLHGAGRTGTRHARTGLRASQLAHGAQDLR